MGVRLKCEHRRLICTRLRKLHCRLFCRFDDLQSQHEYVVAFVFGINFVHYFSSRFLRTTQFLHMTCLNKMGKQFLRLLFLAGEPHTAEKMHGSIWNLSLLLMK